MSKKNKMRIAENEWKEDTKFPELLNYEEILYTPQQLEDINKDEGSKLTEIEEGAMNLANHNSDELSEGTTNKYLLDFSVTEQKLADAAVTFGKVNKWFAGKMGTAFPASPSDGELFLRTDQNKFYRYSTSSAAWIAVDYHDDSTRFANNVIKNALIESLDAGKITTGYLATGRLDTTVAYITQSAMIADAVIKNAHIGNAEIQSAKIASINADTITTGTLTGRTVQTAESGDRVSLEITGAVYPHNILLYTADVIRGRLFSSATGLNISAAQTGDEIFFTIAGVSSVWMAAGSVTSRTLVPISTAENLGLSGYKWKDLHLSGNIYVDGNVDGVDVSAHAANASAHHSSTSDNLTITPANVDIKADGYIRRAGTNYVQLTASAFDMYKPLILNTLASDPSSETGKIIFHTGTGHFRGFDGSNWRDLCFYDERNA